ncbi:MAG: hypothetical protein GX190_03745 [Mollicutes bacterium]|nr:hypothetical protein [Mollicutes bacterium]
MGNFLKFIEEDIEAKNTLLSTIPITTKTNKKKYNQKIDEMIQIYEGYKNSVKKYIVTKSKSFNIKVKTDNVDALKQTVEELEYIRKFLNPVNTYFEKMEFDSLLFDIKNYSDFNFNSMNEIIERFIQKFEQVGITLTSNNFDYTCYVKEYMSSFLDIRNNGSGNYISLSKIFEKIYWENPELIRHIELNFRKLIKKYRKAFENYISSHQKEIMAKHNISNYKECIEQLKFAYSELELATKENIQDIIELAKSGEIDIENYFKDSKVRDSNFSSLMIEKIDPKDEEAMKRFYSNLEKLKTNIEEYSNYIKFLPFFKDFKNEYEKQLPGVDQGQGTRGGQVNKLKTIASQIAEKESKLAKLNRKIFAGESSFFDFKSNIPKGQLKHDSIILAKELYTLYEEYDREGFREKVKSILNKFLTVPELLRLYNNYDYFKKKDIKRVFKLNSYDEVIKLSEEFDAFARNPNNIIINGVSLFEENNVAKIIVNRYRLYNINITEENFEPIELDELLNKIKFILRVNEIEKSPITVEKIWFMVQVEKLMDKENK